MTPAHPFAQNLLKPIRWSAGRLTLLDQRKLPSRIHFFRPKKVIDVARAIRTLAVRGAPAIGIAAAYGIVLGLKGKLAAGGSTHARRKSRDMRERLEDTIEQDIQTLGGTRPTAVNLFWALDRMRRKFRALSANLPATQVVRAMEAEAVKIHKEDE